MGEKGAGTIQRTATPSSFMDHGNAGVPPATIASDSTATVLSDLANASSRTPPPSAVPVSGSTFAKEIPPADNPLIGHYEAPLESEAKRLDRGVTRASASPAWGTPTVHPTGEAHQG
jgi:hypothetical protein